MKRGLIIGVAALAAMIGGASAPASTEPSANVEPVATVISNVNTIFDFDLYNCPAGAEIVIVDWEARQPARPDSNAASALASYGLSNGDPVQHLTLFAGSGSFLAGEQWVGSGHIACGLVIIPVEGSGTAKSATGL